jgi:hypothetical protein
MVYGTPGPYAGVEYNFTLCTALQHMYHGQPYAYARVELIPMPESTLFLSQGLWTWPQMLEGRGRVLGALSESEPVFFNIYGAQEPIPRNEFRQPM